MTKEPRFNEQPIERSRRPATQYDFWATGFGVFPVDMLRYDACWPSSTDDALRMVIEHGEFRRSIHLRSFTPPTPDRWLSFGWSLSQRSF